MRSTRALCSSAFCASFSICSSAVSRTAMTFCVFDLAAGFFFIGGGPCSGLVERQPVQVDGARGRLAVPGFFMSDLDRLVFFRGNAVLPPALYCEHEDCSPQFPARRVLCLPLNRFVVVHRPVPCALGEVQ